MAHQPPKQQKKKPQQSPKEKKAIKPAHGSEVHAGVQCGAIDVAAVAARPGRASSRPPSGDRS